MNSGMPLFDSTYSRHQGSETSLEANLAANVSKLKRALQIYALAVKSGDVGITSAEIERVLGIAKNKFSGRLTDLEIGVKNGEQTVRLVKTNEKRGEPKCAIYLAEIYSNGVAVTESIQ